MLTFCRLSRKPKKYFCFFTTTQISTKKIPNIMPKSASFESAECRICRKTIKLSNLLKSNEEWMKIIIQIKDVLGIELIKGNDIPSSICRMCNSQFLTVVSFKQRCIDSNRYYLLKQSLVIIKEENDNGTDIGNETKIQADNEIEIKSEDDDRSNNQDDNFESDNSEHSQRNEQQIKTSKRVKKKIPKGKVLVSRKQKIKAPKICEFCGNVFTSNYTFALHLQRHKNNKTNECELCSAKFYTSSELKRHMRKHTGEKPYECKYCQRRFADYGSHVKHERTHTNDRPFRCNHCEKSFSCGSILKNHLVTHTGERLFKCGTCNKSFPRQDNLIAHMKSIYHQKNVNKGGKHDFEIK